MKIIRPITIDDSNLVSSNVPETEYPLYEVAVTYGLGDTVILIADNIHRVYESLQAGNLGNDPLDDVQGNPDIPPVYWLLLGEDNRWKMFDGYVNTQTSNLDTIDTTIIATGRCDSAIALNVSGATIQYIATDAIDGVVYDQTYSLVSDSGITDWYAYFFEPIVRLQDFSVTDIPPYANLSIQTIITDTGNQALCGALIFGLSKEIGDTQYGMNLGITDYSVKQVDDFGNFTILERAFSRNSDMTLWIPNTLVDQTQILLSGYRATPCVYIGSDDYASSIVYGYYKEFSINITYKLVSVCTLSLEGLT